MQQSIGPYQLDESLGRLPFGELTAATHPARTESLAVLLLDDRLAEDHRFRGLLRLEIARAGSVRHPAIARAVEVGEHGGALYVVFERPAHAQTLARAFAEGDPPSRADTAALVRALAEGLDIAHGRRLVHGVLGPTTVLVGRDGGISIVGIGLNGAVEETGLSAVIVESVEAAFTSPEQRNGGRAVAASDGYALGVLAAALLRVQAPPAGPADAIGRVLARQCAADPGGRYPTCAAFASALADAVAPATQPGTVEALELPPAAPAPTSPPIVRPAPPPTPQPRGASIDSPSVPPPTPTLESPLPPHVPILASGPPGLASSPPGHPDVSDARPYGAAQHASGPAFDVDQAGVTVTTADLTPTMAELLRPAPQRDVIGDAIRLLADRVPAIDGLLDQYAPDGRLGPAPVGVAVTGVLALLLLLAGLAWPATVLIMIAVVLYVMPRLGAALTASERASPRVVRATGGASVRLTPDAIGTGRPELIVGDGAILGLRVSEHEALIPFGRPVAVERPAHGAAGVVGVVIRHDLPGTTVTYISPNKILLDVRSPDGTVLYRRPPYQGEPGDCFWSPGNGTPPGTAVTAATAPAVAEATFEAGQATGSPTTPPAMLRSAGHRTSVPMPPVAQAAIQRAAKSAAWKGGAILFGGLAALIVLPQLVGGFSFFVFVAILALGIYGSPTVMRGLSLWSARDATTLARVAGPVVVTEHGTGKSRRYFVHLADGTRFTADSDMHRALAYAGEIRLERAGPFDFDQARDTPEGLLQTQHEIPAATTTFVPGARLLLEIVNPSGDTIYRDPALDEVDLGPPRLLV